jgi:formate-dependent nitrite reductase membrane component NrfD
MTEPAAFRRGPQQPAEVAPSASQRDLRQRNGWTGPTYYGRPQLKAAPFNKAAVGGYIFLAGLSGAAALLTAIIERTRGRTAEDVVRRGRYLSLLAPTVGPMLLIFDLHTPQRFYNMLRIAKATSPMSIGTWILMSFSAFAGLSGFAQFVADRVPLLGFMRGVARASGVPAAVTGAGLATYTASLLSATSTPDWAAAPSQLAVRFGASSVASAAAALALAARSGETRRTLETVACAALAVEGAGTASSGEVHRDRGIDAAFHSRWGEIEKAGAVGVGIALPVALYAASRLMRGTPCESALSDAASLAVLTGSLILRVATLGVGDDSATNPDVSFAFAQPRNLPRGGRRMRR